MSLLQNLERGQGILVVPCSSLVLGAVRPQRRSSTGEEVWRVDPSRRWNWNKESE